MATCPSLFRIPTIKRFKVTGDLPCDDPAELENFPMFATIEEYETDWLMNGGHFWYDTISRCTELKSYSAMVPLFASHGLSDPSKDLNAALLLRAGTLEKLSLNFSGANAEALLGDLGEPERLACLPQLHRLRKLAIDTFTLFGSLDVRSPKIKFLYNDPLFPRPLERLD